LEARIEERLVNKMYDRLPASQLERSPSTSSASEDEDEYEDEALLGQTATAQQQPPVPIEANAVVRRSEGAADAGAGNGSSSEDDDDDGAKSKAATQKVEETVEDKDKEVEFLYDQDFYRIREECLKNDVLFEDPEFPPDNDLLRQRSKRVEDDVEWMRPHDYLRPEEPILVSERNEGFDIKTTLDSWFVPAMSAIAESESLLRRVVPEDQGFREGGDEKYAGIFHFRFWFGRWIEIVVDDRIPVRKGLPIYMRSSSNVELWPTLLEKAYAKAKGSYELLNHWLPVDGCIELTGGVPERIRNLSMFLSRDPEAADTASGAKDRLFFDLVRASQMGNVILGSLPLPPKGEAKRTPEGSSTRAKLAEAAQLGLETRYVYRVTQVANLGGGGQIIRVKNCSGPKPIVWTGAWNPNDANKWSNVPQDIRKELDSETMHDGGFWMAYADFLKYFHAIDICHISTDVDQDVTFHGRWEKGLNAGGVQRGDFKNFARNPQCFIRLSEPDPRDAEGRSAAIISLMQRRQPQSRAKGTNKIGFKIYRVDERTEELNAPFFAYRRNDGGHKCVAKTPTWQDGRETNVRIRLSRGKYCIIPCTFLPDQEGDFILRVHIERYAREEAELAMVDDNDDDEVEGNVDDEDDHREDHRQLLAAARSRGATTDAATDTSRAGPSSSYSGGARRKTST